MLRLAPASPAVQRRPVLAVVVAPAAATTRISAIGDSWTQGNEAIISRNGSASPVPSDEWTYQLAVTELGFTHSTTPGESGITQNIVIRCGYGGQRTTFIKDSWLAITAANAGRKSDIKIMWPGRNDVMDANGDANTIAGVNAMIADSTNDLIILAIPYAGIGISTGSQHRNLLVQQKIARDYWRTKRRYVHPLNLDFMGLDDSDGTDANNVLVAGMAAPQNMFASAATDQNHPNYLAQPRIAAALKPLVRAMMHQGVYVRRQQIPDVPYDMPEGATIEVYMEGYVTSVAISADDPVQPGLFTIRMKAGSNKVAELVRTNASPGAMNRILYLGITASGVDTAGNPVSHTQTIRVKPSVVGTARTQPFGCELVRDPHATATARRVPMMVGSASPWADGPRFAFVWHGRFLEDGLINELFATNGLATLMERNGSHRFLARIEDSAGAIAINWTSTGPLFNLAAGNVWLAFSCDLSGAGAAQMWAWTAGGGDQDVKPATPSITVGTGLIDLDAGKPAWGSHGGFAAMRAAVRRCWIDNRYIDFSVAANRRKFWNADGTMVDLGAEGRVDGVRPAYDLYTGTPGDYTEGFNRGYAEAPSVADPWGRGLAFDPDPKPY